MEKRTPLILLVLILGISTCFAGETSALEDQNIAIHTWGGSDVLQNIFRAVSMLVYGNTKTGLDATFTSIIRIAMTVGAFCCISVAMFRHNFEPFIKSFFLPSVGIMCCVLSPRTTVYIKDHIAAKSSSPQAYVLYKVQNVPFLLGKLPAIVSTVCFKFTEVLEKIAHGTGQPSKIPGQSSPDAIYNWTGHIYAGEEILMTRRSRIANPILEDNFRSFCRDCVFRDLGLGLYTKQDLIKEKNLTEFLETHTSKIRTTKYREIPEDGTTRSSDSFIPCQEAMRKMNAFFGKNKGNLREIVVGEVSSDLNLLLKEEPSPLDKLIKQQIAIKVLKEELPGSLASFTANRAGLLQKETQIIIGTLGVWTILKLEAVFEAIIYFIFPLLVLTCFFAMGIKPLIHWCHALIWINTWPPMFVIIKFILSTAWNAKAKHLYGDSFGLTIFTSEGLADIYGDMSIFALVAMGAIPTLSWFIVKGGVSSMVQLASSVMAPGSSAASSAATEQVYGNYNFGNVNRDNLNMHNAQAFRQTYSGLLSRDSVSIDSGTETTTYTPNANALYIRQGDSHLREGISRTQAFNNAVQDSFNSTQSTLQETSKGYSENLSDSTNKGVGLVNALSKSFQTGENFNTQTSTGVQEAVQYMQGLGHDYSHAKNITSDQGMREVIRAGLGRSFGIEGNYQDGSSKSESDSLLKKAYDSESFQKHLQTLTNVSRGEMANFLGSEDTRLHDDFSASFNQTKAASEQYRAAYTAHEALSNLKSYGENQTVAFQQNLNQRFVDFLSDKYQDAGRVNEILEMPSEQPAKQALIQEFVKDFYPQNLVNTTSSSLQDSYAQHAKQVQAVSPESFDQKREDQITEGEPAVGQRFGGMGKQANAFINQINKELGLNNNQPHLEISGKTISRDGIQEEFEAQLNSSQNLSKTPVAVHFKNHATSFNTARDLYNLLFKNGDQPKKEKK